jgi:hypothetical protein
MPLLDEEIVTVFVSPEDYPYHINQVASVSTGHLRIIRKKFSMSTPYVLEEVAIASCGRIEYAAKLSPVRIVLGTLLVALMLAIFYFVYAYAEQMESGTSVPVGLLAIALVAGVRWMFMSRQHHMIFHLKEGSRLRWRSRPGDFKYKEWAVNKLREHFKTSRLAIGERHARAK